MKFSTTLVTLLAAASAYSFAIEKRDEMEDLQKKLQSEMDKQGFSQDNFNAAAGAANSAANDAAAAAAAAGASAGASAGANTGATTGIPSLSDTTGATTGLPSASGSTSDECKKIVDQYYACIPKEKDYDKACDFYLSAECQKLHDTKLTSNKGCENASFEEKMVEQLFLTLDMQCARDESGDYCPISKKSKKNAGKPKKQRENITEEDFKDSCKSAKCKDLALKTTVMLKNTTEQLTQAFNNFGKQKREFKSFDDILNYLNSAECQPTSGSQSMKVGGAALVATVATFLYYFF